MTDAFRRHYEFTHSALIEAVEQSSAAGARPELKKSLLEKLRKVSSDYQDEFFESECTLAHPAMGMLSIERVESEEPLELFASPVATRHAVIVKVYQAQVAKESNTIEPGPLLVSTMMSEMQLGELFVNTNRGSGYPVTLLESYGEQAEPYDPAKDPTKQKRPRLTEKLFTMDSQSSEAVERLKTLASELVDKPRGTKQDAKAIQRSLGILARNTVGNNAHAINRFNEHISGSVERARLEIHLEALSQGRAAKALLVREPGSGFLRLTRPTDQDETQKTDEAVGLVPLQIRLSNSIYEKLQKSADSHGLISQARARVIIEEALRNEV